MRKLLAVALVAVGVGGVAAAADAAPRPGLHLTPLTSIRFPDRAFVVATRTKAALAPAQIQVSEDGRPVSALSIVAASETTKRTFGVVLVIDASNSMRGAPIRGAVAAARAFVDRSVPAQALGVITFNRMARVVARPTTDRGAIAAALRPVPRLDEKTHLWDAARRAIGLLRTGKVTAGSVVLLTDGRDIGSRFTPVEVAAEARAAGVRVFSVGLRSKQFRRGPLVAIAQATYGGYAEAASAAGLAPIYRALSGRLAREYLIRYRSTAGPGKRVEVSVAVAGLPGVASWSYDTPVAAVGAPFHRSLLDRFVGSPASAAVISLLAAALAWFGVSSILRRSRSSVRLRIGEFVSFGTTSGTDDASLRVRERFLGHVLLTAERVFQRTPWWDRFKEELEIGEFPVRPVPLVAATAAASAGFALLGLLSPVLALLVVAPPLAVRTVYKEKLRRRRRAFEEQLPDSLTVLASSLRAGHSFVGGLSSVLDEAEEPARSELSRAVADEQLGVPVEEALLRVARRMASADLEQVALVASLQRETGGNTAEVLDIVVKAIQERFQLRRHVRALTAQGRMARWILTALPVVVAGWMAIMNPHYLSPLLHTTGGQVILVLATVMVVAGSLTVKRITDIEI